MKVGWIFAVEFIGIVIHWEECRLEGREMCAWEDGIRENGPTIWRNPSGAEREGKDL